jgi:hypothetical protein
VNRHLQFAVLPIFLLIFGSNQNLFSQAEPTFQWGESVSLTIFDDANLPIPLTIDEKGNYLAVQELRDEGEVDYWYQFNSEFKKTRSTKMAFNRGSDGSSRSIYDYVFIGDKMYLLYESWIKNSFEHKLQIVELKSNGEPTIRKETLATIYATKDNNIGQFKTAISPDKSKFLVFSEKSYDKKLPELALIQVFETGTWKEIVKKDVKFDNNSAKNPNHSIAVNDNGDVCFFKDLDEKKEKGLFFFSLPKNGRLTGHKLTIGEKSIMGIKASFNQKGEPVAIGIYEEEKTVANFVYGIIFVKLSADGTGILNQETLEMQGTNKENFNLDLVYEYKDNIENGVQLIDVYERSDGQFLVLSELFKTSLSNLESKNGIVSNNSFEFGNAFVFWLNEDGLLQRITKLEKYQKESGQIEKSKFGSVLPWFNDDNLYLLWNNTEMVLPYSNWQDSDIDSLSYKKDLFGSSTFNPTFLEVIQSNGRKRFERKKYGLPLSAMHEKSELMVSMRGDIGLSVEDGLIIVAQDSANSNIFRIGKIKLK